MVSMRSVSIVLFSCLVVSTNLVLAQKPRNGVYTYTIRWDEFDGKDLGNTCTVVVYGDSIKVVHNGKPNLTGKKGDVLVQGVILRHKSGKWIIAQSRKDINATEIGACGGGPIVIDFKRKVVWLC